MALDFPPNIAEPDPLVDGQQWTDTGSVPNVVWTYSETSGWSRLASTLGQDPNLQIEPTVGSLTVGLSTGDTTGMTGINNTLVGKQNGTAMAAGVGNTTVGTGAGKVLADGNDNTLVGKNAGASLGGTNADDNVFIGSGAQGSFSQALDCVVVGKDASTLGTDENDAIVIGAGAVGKGSGTATIGNESTCTDVHLNGTLHITGVSAGEFLKIDADGESVISSITAISSAPEAFCRPFIKINNDVGTNDPTAAAYLESFRFPYAFTLTAVNVWATAAVAQEMIIDIHNDVGVSIMTTNKITIDNGDLTSLDAAQQPVITQASFAANELITIMFDTAAAISSCHYTLIGTQI